MYNRTALPLEGVPAGAYTLSIIVYAWETGERQTGQAGELVADVYPVQTLTLP